MKGKVTIITLVLVILGMLGFLGGYVLIASNDQPRFAEDGYVLSSVSGSVERFDFAAGEKYKNRIGEAVTYRDVNGVRVDVPNASFLHYDDGGKASFTGGILVNFKDLSDNFINNYYVSGGLEIVSSGEGYTAHSAAGDIQLGDHLWKLSDSNYLVRSRSLKVVFSETDVREVSDFVQVSVTEDGIISILTAENRWDTISESCYIQTADGVKIYPVTQLLDNGTYKMSVAKLSVGADDAIVLTEDETRRQIVPELNITAVDGTDGSDGVAGAEGTDGASGNDGKEGTDGTTGSNGTSGTNGASGESGAGGATGDSGSEGKNGYTGATGTAGRDAFVQSTTNSALPIMTITSWDLTATSLRGTIYVQDEAGALQLESDSNQYFGTVAIYNVATGEKILCHQVADATQGAESGGTEFTDFADGNENVFFTTEENALMPDTAYRLSVLAYYKMDETIYSREFITRTFYTDSTGVFISKSSVTENSVTVNMRVSEEYRDVVNKVEVYLMTPEQNKDFSLTSATNRENYLQKYELDYTAGGITLDKDGAVNTVAGAPQASNELPYTDLTANSNYVARVVVSTKSGVTSLTKQVLSLQTLKTPPVWGDSVPEANYNRVTGGFEVYRPKIQDVHGGITEYEYVAYAEDGTVVQTRRVLPQDGEPVVFFLPSGVKYSFGVKAIFDDNEKQVVYDLGRTDLLKADGATLPGVTFEPQSSTSAEEYNQIIGTIIVNLANANINLEISQDKPLELHLYADQVYDQKISVNMVDSPVLENPDDPNTNLYTVSITQSTNDTRIHVDFQKLYKNTTYTATLVGYLDLGDGNGSVKRTIGTVSFRTKNTVALVAEWPEGTDTASALNKVLKLSAADSVEAARGSYAREELQQGQVTLELYNGMGVGKVRIASTNIVDQDALQEIYTGNGYAITEADFGNIKLTPNQNYTLVVSMVADSTARMDKLEYVNTFDEVEKREMPITAGATPPDLLSDSAGGVKVTPIYNINAPDYGAKVDTNLPDNTLIGYKLESTYDNVQRLAAYVTYYAQEYSEFYNALVKSRSDPIGKDGIGSANKLMTMTQKVPAGSDTLPAVAVLFGGTKTSDADAKYWNGAYVYYAGAVETSGSSLGSGMGRGFRYVFSYTAKYSPSGNLNDEGTLNVYPYDHSDYESAKNAIGAGKENNVVLGKGVAYVLNSGMCEAPRIDPAIHSYLYSATGTYDSNSGIGGKTTGNAEIHYSFTDIDHTVVTSGPEESRTQIVWNGLSESIGKNSVGSTDWFKVTFPYVVEGAGEPLISPELTISRYQLDYSAIMRDLSGSSAVGGDSETFYLCHIPVEHNYGQKFSSTSYQSSVHVSVTKNEAENKIRFDLTSGVGSQAASELYTRAYLLKMTFTAMDNSGLSVGPIYLPLYEDATGPYAQMATGLLASLVGKQYKMEAEILYDSGKQGWGLLEDTSRPKALRFISNTNNEFAFDSYVAANGLSIVPSGALGTFNGLTLEGIRKTVTDKTRAVLRTTFLENTSLPASRLYYVYAGHFGVDAGTGNSRVDATGRYFVPKDYATYKLTFDGSDLGTLESMTPTIRDTEISTGYDWMGIKQTFTIEGVTQADQEGLHYVAHISVYESEEAAKSLYAQDVATININVDKDTGKPLSNGVSAETGLYEIHGLEKGKDYWYVVWMKVKGHDTVLIDSSTALPAVYHFKTIEGVSITPKGDIEYSNTGYYAKTLLTSYGVSSYLNLTAKYDIFPTQADAENGTSPIYTHAYLNDNNFFNSQAPDGFPLRGGSSANIIQIDLAPRVERNKLVPGGTYYLRISVCDKSGQVIGSEIMPFAIPLASNYGAFVYAPYSTKESVTFQVTVTDAQFSFMTPDTSSGGRYAVRFAKVAADGTMTRLLTTYDDQLFDERVLKQEFVLSNNVLTAGSGLGEIEPDTMYKLLIYAVPDTDHDGLTATGSGDNQNAEWFLGSEKNFLAVLDSFWNANYSKKTDATTLNTEKLFLISEKSQKTTTESGLLVDTSATTLTRGGGSKLTLTLSESYGVIKDDNTQSFKKVVWSVSGISARENEAVNLFGTSLVSAGDKIFVKATDTAGYSVYTYSIPETVPTGVYTVTIQLYENESDLSPYVALSYRFQG